MDKERLERIGKFLNYRMIVHRNVENDTPWTVEEKMIQELYDNYLDLLIKYKEKKEVIDKVIQLLEDDNICADIRRLKPKWNENKYGVEYELLDILKEVSE
jgi:hypothetical protein